MCTATWRCDRLGYEVFFNRDELRIRSEADRPERHEENGVACIAPTDPDGGGTWIGVNDRGVTVALLNFYPQTDFDETSSLIGPTDSGTGETVSRGILVRRMLSLGGIEEIRSGLGNESLERYRPFTLLVFGRDFEPHMFRWFGRLSERVSPEMPVSSSSFRTTAVVGNRIALFAELVPDGLPPNEQTTALVNYHRSHLPEAGPFSVCMHRDDACTRSFAHIRVGNDRAELIYTPGSPCETEPDPPLVLPLNLSPVR